MTPEEKSVVDAALAYAESCRHGDTAPYFVAFFRAVWDIQGARYKAEVAQATPPCEECGARH